jgi:two-component system response regulator YesN
MVKKWSMFKRLFISYIIVTLIPVSAFFTILYENSVTNTQNELEMFSTSNLYQIRDNLDLRIQEFRNIAAQISSNPKLSYYNMVLDDYKVLEGIEELGKYKAGNSFTSDIMLFYHKATSLYSSKGTSSVEALLSRSYRFTEEENQQFLERLRNQEDRPMLEVFPTSDIVMYMIPLPVIGGYHNSVAIFTFHGRSVRKMISEGNSEHKGSTYILDAGKNLILSIDNAGTEENELLATFKEETRPGVHTANFQNNLYSLITTVSEETGWHYVTVLPKKKFLEQVTAREIWIIICAIVGFLCCIVTALTLALSNYRPIRKLNRFIEEHLPQTEVEGSANEIDHISSAVNQAIVVNQKLKSELDYHQYLFKQSLLIRLLKGEVGDRDEIVKLMKSSGLVFDGPHFTVLVARCEENESLSQPNGSLLDYMAEYSARGIAYAVEFGNDNSLVIIANTDQAKGRSEPSRLAEAVVEFIEDVIGTRVNIGIGKCYNELWGVNHSYIEACAAMDSKIYKNQRNIVFFVDIVSFPQSFWQSPEEEIYWVHSLKHGDSLLARKALDDLFQKMEDGHVPASVNRYVCFKLMDAAVQVINEYSANNQTLFSADDVSEILIKAVNYTSPADYKVQMYGLIDVICNYVASVNGKREISLITHVENFMEEHYKDPTVSLEIISQKFGYSIYYWSRFFKEKIGCHFSDYLWNLRVNEAKRQFATSNKMLKEIVLELGYGDLTSFTRRFKSEEGITPGQYRRLYSDMLPPQLKKAVPKKEH